MNGANISRRCLRQYYLPQQEKIEQNYAVVKQHFEFVDKRGKKRPFINWANKNLRQMAKEVNHELEYDMLYSQYCEFTHPTVHLADHFLKVNNGTMEWSIKAYEPQIAFIFRDAGAVYSCFLSCVLGKEFNISIDKEIEECFDVGFKDVDESAPRANGNKKGEKIKQVE